MNGTEIPKVNEEKHLVITITSDLKPAKHCSEVKTANMLIGFIGRTFELKIEKVVLTLYNALGYCVQFWSPYTPYKPSQHK